jgi:hypothetical protein
MEFICIFGGDYLKHRSKKRTEKREMKAYFRSIEATQRASEPAKQLTPDEIVGWETVDGKRVKKLPYSTVLEQISSVDVYAIKPHLDDLRTTMDLADRMGVTAEPFTVAMVGPPRQGKTQLSLNILKILRALGIICVERSTQDAFCDDFVYATDKAREAKDEQGRYLYFPTVLGDSAREKKCKPEVLFVDEFQSQVEDPPDVPFLLNGVIPLNWQPPMANLHNKGKNFNFAFWLLSCNNEFVRHKFSVTAIRDRMHKRLVVLDGKAYDQTCKKNMDPCGSFLGGFKTCKGQFGVWEEFITQESVGRTAAASHGRSVTAGLPPTQSDSSGRSVAQTLGKTVSNQKFRRVKDTLSVTQPRCKHMRFVPFTELIIEVLDAAKAKLDMAVQGAQAVEARVEVIRETMMELSVEAPEFQGGTSDKAYSLESGYDMLTRSEASSVAAAPAKPTLFD